MAIQRVKDENGGTKGILSQFGGYLNREDVSREYNIDVRLFNLLEGDVRFVRGPPEFNSSELC